MKTALLAPLAALALGCTPPAAPPPPEAAPGCNPLVGDDCLTPFPSSFYEAADANSPTGVHIAIPDGQLPVSARGTPISTARFNKRDGFSPATPFLVYFKSGVDPSSLPTADHLDVSITPQSPVQVLEFLTGTRVPVMAEVDVNAGAGQKQALIVRPMVRLKPNTRYVIALVGLKDPTGKPIAPAPFVALRDKTTLSNSLMPVASREEDLFAMLDKAGVPRASLTLAWDVTTGTDTSILSHVPVMVDDALAMADGGKLGYTITDMKDTPDDPHLLREIKGTFKVPSYLASDAPDAMLAVGSDGKPTMRAISEYPFVIHVPQCAKTARGPIPVFFFGHGLFGTALGELNTDYQKQFMDRVCMVEIATDWIGVSANDVPTITSKVITDMNNFFIVTDRLQQAHVNAQVFTRLFLSKIKDDVALTWNAVPITDGKQVYYYGISNGGIQGGTYMALSKDVIRGVLNVPGCDWNLMMFRSSNFRSLEVVLDSVYPDTLDQQVIVTLTQGEWDYSDPVTFAPHLLGEPLDGRMPKRILVQESEGDAQVPNMATRILARIIGLDGLSLENQVFGITEKQAPLDSAYTQWDVKPSPLPPVGNTPAPMDNQAHGGARLIGPLQDQIQAFFKPDGQVTKVCDGPCVFPATNN